MLEINGKVYQLVEIFRAENGNVVILAKPVEQTCAQTMGFAIADVTHGA